MPYLEDMVSKVLAVVFAILVIPSVVLWWFEQDYMNTENYMEIVSPLVSETEMQGELASAITTAVKDDIDIARLMDNAAKDLPPRSAGLIRTLTEPMEMAVDNYIRHATRDAVDSEEFRHTWDQLNRVAHYNAVKTGSGTVYVELGPIIETVKKELDGSALAGRIPVINERYVLLESPALEWVLDRYEIIKVLVYALPIIAVIVFVLAVWLSRERFEIVLFASMSTAIAMLVLLSATYLGHQVVAPETPDVVYNAFAASRRSGIRWVLAISAITALVTWVLKRRVTDRPA